MKQSALNIRIIEPEEGYYLTQANRKEGEEIILSKKVYLSNADAPENWVEISESEGDALKQKELENANL